MYPFVNLNLLANWNSTSINISDEDVSKDEKAIVKDEIASFISNDVDKARLDERS